MSMSRASADPSMDLEKGDTGAKETATKEVNPRVAMCVMVLVDVVAVFQVLFLIGMVSWMVSISNNWWEPLPAVVILLVILVLTLWVKPKTNYTNPTPGSDDSDLSNKLLAFEK